MAEIIQKTDKKTIYREGKTLVKLFNSDYPKSDVLNEALNTARVEEGTFLNVPAVHEVTKVNGEWAIVQDFVEGKTLQQLMDENPDKTAQYLEEFVDLQVEVLEQKVPLLTKLKDKMHRKISSTKFDKTTRYDLHILLDSLPAHDKLCHGDFNPGNIIVSPDGRKFIIDWAHATQGNARCDAARTYLLFKLEKKDDLAEQYLKLFCEKTGIAKQLVQKALPIVAASQTTKAVPEEQAFLEKWVNVVDYE